jgi:hypothetical protein
MILQKGESPMNVPFFWQDSIEIIFFTSVLYLFSRWLHADKEKNLLLWFYGYCLLFIVSSLAQVTLISTVLLYGAPAALVIFITVHQRTLQKNLISLVSIIPSQSKGSESWIQTIIAHALQQHHSNQEMLVVVEQNNSLHTMLEAPCYLYTPVQDYLLKTILSSSLYNPQRLMWITSTGKFIAYNCRWKTEDQHMWMDHPATSNDAWKENAALYTSHTDALVIKTHAHNATFSIVSQGKIVEHLHASQAYAIIQGSILKESSVPLEKKGASHGHTSKKRTTYQPHT